MKNNFYAILILFNLCMGTGNAQITTPVIRANFGVDGDLRSNFFNNILQAGNDEWFSNGTAANGTGQYVIDTNGAASILAAYVSRPASRKQPFSKLMRQAPYSIVNNRLVLDAVFHRDYHGDDSTVFASGSNKNGDSPGNWSCPISQGIPDKNDILDAMIHVRRAGPNVTDTMWMFGGISIENTTGNRYFDFELYQSNIAYNRPTRSFTGFGPNMGHTSWTFDASGNVITPGDIIFSFEYGGSGLSMVQARIWVSQASLSITPANFNWGGLYDGAYNGAPYGYASIAPKTAGAFYSGLHNTLTQWAGPFGLIRQNDALVTDYAAIQYMEFSVNMSKLGLDPGHFAHNACGNPFRRVLIKTRSSSSFTAELKDFISPFSMFNYPIVDATTQYTYFCRTMPSTTVSVFNPMLNSTYTWTTPNGNIVGSTTGTSITVNAPGTYYVTQQLHLDCPLYAMDSVKIFFDSVCQLLKTNVLNLRGVAENRRTTLNWDVTDNEDAASYDIEFSTNNRNFSKLGNIIANTQSGSVSYSYVHPAELTGAALVYYRIKCIGKNGSAVYSKTIAIRYDETAGAIVFPNPTNGDLWMRSTENAASAAEITVTNAYGKIIKKASIHLAKGQNIQELPGLQNMPAGIYIIKVSVQNKTYMQRIIKK